MKNCIVIPDSFKGTLSAIEICTIFQEEIAKLQPDCQVKAVPVADGGEGTVDCFLYALSCQRVEVQAEGPLGEPVDAYYARFGDTAVIEMAMCAGLPQVEGRQDPEGTTTYGVGQVMRRALEDGCTKLVLGLGGSCTNDGGAGMAAALGTQFTDEAGATFVPNGGTLDRVAHIDTRPAKALLEGRQVLAMCDIDNPMYGETGAAYIFGPQKGAGPEAVKRLDANLRHLSAIIEKDLGLSVATLPGSGAAGAMGAGVVAFLGGELRSGIDTVLDLIGFDRMLEQADMIFTGEGRIDSQSLRGKVISGIALRAKEKGVPVVAVVGSVGEGAQGAYELGVSAIFSINQQAEAFETARFKSAQNLRATVQNIIRLERTLR